jgi:O-6-methylguanine DNA methyltransferase
MIFWTSVEGRLTGDGRIRVYIAAREGRIWRIAMDAEGHPFAQDEFLRELGDHGATRWPGGTGSGLLDAAAAQVEDYIAGYQIEFDLPLEFEGTPFQVDVWKALMRVPFGALRTYGDIAKVIGHPAAVRAVGQANGRNHLPLIVPCHRIVAAGGKVGGYSGGVSLKKALLAHETVILARRRERLEAARDQASLRV